MSPAEKKSLLDLLKKEFDARKEEIEVGEWNIEVYIKLVPKTLWQHDIAGFISQSLKRRCRVNAAMRNVKLKDEWPYNPGECPQDLSELPSHEFGLISTTYFSMERNFLMHRRVQVRGPLLTALSITSLTDATVTYMSLLNRISCLTSYQTVDSISRKAIMKRVKNGSFGEAVKSAFHSFAFDNINV